MVKKFKSKPIIIEALQWKGNNFNEIYEFTEGQANLLNVHGEKLLVLLTLEGSMSASIGDFIIRGRVGEYYPCKYLPFCERYEEVKEVENEKDIR